MLRIEPLFGVSTKGFNRGRRVSDLFATPSAVISPCGRYRYRLERDGPGEGRTVVIMVNPSTADATEDDATIRKLKGFGARNQWGRIIVGNLFAYRATDVRALGKVADPVGPLNDMHLNIMEDEADRIIVAWGPVTKVPQRIRSRWQEVWGERRMGTPIYSIGAPAKCGHPKHPLMLAYETPIVPWSPPSCEPPARCNPAVGWKHRFPLHLPTKELACPRLYKRIK